MKINNNYKKTLSLNKIIKIDKKLIIIQIMKQYNKFQNVKKQRKIKMKNKINNNKIKL